MSSISDVIPSGLGQTILMGCLFFFVFMAYFMIQGFSATLYGPQLGADMEATLYLSFTLACFVAPSVVNKLGCRLCMFLGMLGYATLVAASLVYFVLSDGSSNGKASPFAWIVIAGGAILGVGAALLWTSQGRLILEYGGDDGRDAGRLWGIFWGIFNLSAVAGGVMTATFFAAPGNAGNTGSVGLYVIFLALILIGAFGTFLLKNPQDVAQTPKPHSPEDDHLLPSPDTTRESMTAAGQKYSWADEARATLKLFATRRYLILAPIYFYSGFNQPYQLVVMGNRSFTPTVLGLELALFYAAEIVGGFFAGWMLDASIAGGHCRRRAATQCLSLFATLMIAGYVLALFQEWHLAGIVTAGLPSILGQSTVAVSMMMLLWGFSDSQIQTYVMWDIGVVHAGDGKTQARAVGFYKMIQSAGWSLGFALSPTTRLAPMSQWACTGSIGIVGVALMFFELLEVKATGSKFTSPKQLV